MAPSKNLRKLSVAGGVTTPKRRKQLELSNIKVWLTLSDAGPKAPITSITIEQKKRKAEGTIYVVGKRATRFSIHIQTDSAQRLCEIFAMSPAGRTTKKLVNTTSLDPSQSSTICVTTHTDNDCIYSFTTSNWGDKLTTWCKSKAATSMGTYFVKITEDTRTYNFKFKMEFAFEEELVDQIEEDIIYQEEQFSAAKRRNPKQCLTPRSTVPIVLLRYPPGIKIEEEEDDLGKGTIDFDEIIAETEKSMTAQTQTTNQTQNQTENQTEDQTENQAVNPTANQTVNPTANQTATQTANQQPANQSDIPNQLNCPNKEALFKAFTELIARHAAEVSALLTEHKCKDCVQD